MHLSHASRSVLAFRREGFRVQPGFTLIRRPTTAATIPRTTVPGGSDKSGIGNPPWSPVPWMLQFLAHLRDDGNETKLTNFTGLAEYSVITLTKR